MCTFLCEGHIASLNVAMFSKSVPYPVALQQDQPVLIVLRNGDASGESITDANVLKISFSVIVKIGLPRSERSGVGRFFLGCLWKRRPRSYSLIIVWLAPWQAVKQSILVHESVSAK